MTQRVDSSPYVVDVEWLGQHLDDDRIIIIDCRFALAEPLLGRQQYDVGHIPGAYYLDLDHDLSGPVGTHGGRHPMPDWHRFVDTLNLLGIQSVSPTRVIIYDDSRFAFAARLWWMLRYLGHDQVAILDGGLSAWVAAGFSLTADVPSPQVGRFVPQLRFDWLVDIDYVRQRKDALEVMLIDSRSEGRFLGDYEPIDPVAGSIPGAVNAFWQAVSDSAGRLKSTAELKAHWQAMDDAQEAIIYCGSGVTACVNLFSQAVAGKPMGKLYGGGWSDWCSYL